ncbi:hypothetical protein B0J11DRAFT_308728 [Dendryphion nanum]|uniref:NACHT domain-containing protein n=1 Tax=Dendryphion nanum TaxID=256645 RepID=A0A9P9DVZ9_9PLEO|nr:hypothetical protein B0J11DRAFT_308728 [Dendryphion nanum]
MSLFNQALAEFLSDLEKDKDGGGTFYTDVLEHMAASSGPGPVDYSKLDEQLFISFIDDLDHKQQETSKTRRLFRKLRPFISGVSQFTAAGDVMIQAAPDAAVLIYGGARLLLILAEGFDGCFERIVSIMEEVGALLACYQEWSEVFKGHKDMEELLISTYKNVVSFWKSVHRLFTQKGLRKLSPALKPLNEKWNHYHQKLLSDSNRVQMRVSTLESKIRKQKDKEDMCQRVLHWLKADEDERKLDVRRHLRVLEEKRHDKTCDWIFQHESTKSWLESRKSTAMWYNAGPGTGKSITAAAVVRKLRDEKGKTISFFCSFDDSALKQPITLFRCLILQLLKPKDPIPDDVMCRFKEDISRHVSQLSDLAIAAEVLSSLLSEEERVHIVIDGLDEFDDREQLLRYIAQLLQQKKHKIYGIVKWVFTSREDVSTIRDCMKKHGAQEITAAKACLAVDIKSWLRYHLECDHCVDIWADRADGNFLWISHIVPVLKGETATCDEEIEAELARFPKGLTGCYARALSQLTKRLANYDLQRQLARLIFTMVVGARQPLRLSELAQALAASKGTSKPIKRELIQDLGSNLITFDSSLDDNDDDPFVKVSHKSVSDFFCQDPVSLGLWDPDVQQYFVTREEANLELGKAALNYLSALRYEQPQDVSTITLTKEHSFLSHAANFWYSYLGRTPSSKELSKKVIDFIRSEAFWTCIAVQCCISPYLHAVYTPFGSAFSLESSVPGGEDDYILSIPLPGWLETFEPDGPQVIETYHAFIHEWHNVLTKYPSAVDQCMMDFRSQMIMPGRITSQSTRAKILSLYSETFAPATHPLSIVDLQLTSKDIAIKVLEYDELSRKYNARWMAPDGRTLKVKEKTKHKMALASGALPGQKQLFRGSLNPEATEYYIIDLNQLVVQRHRPIEGSFEDFNPSNVSFDAPKRDLGSWQLVSKSNSSNAVAYHCISTGKGMRDPPTRADAFVAQKSSYASMNSPEAVIDSTSDTESDSDGSDDSDSNSDSDDDDKSDSHSDITKHSELGSKSTNTQHCMLLVMDSKPPLWHFWNSSEYKVEAPCVFHPNKPLAIWSERASNASLLDTSSGKLQVLHLPEPPNIDFSSLAACRKEFHFAPSESPDSFYYLLYTAKVTGTGGIGHSVYISIISLTSTQSSEYTLQSKSTPISMNYECETQIRQPFILTDWCDSLLYIAFPPLSCNSKIVRIRLGTKIPMEDGDALEQQKEENTEQEEDEPQIQTLIEPVFFPFSTLYRHPRLRFIGRKPTSRHLTMALILEAKPKPQPANPSQCTPPPFSSRSSTKTPPPSKSNAHDQGLDTPPTVLLWNVHAKKDWRAWDQDTDVKDKGVVDRESRYEMLRGGFLAKNKRFEVTARSGLDWRRQAFLSCA